MRWIERWMAVHAIILLIASGLFFLSNKIEFILISAVISFTALFIWKAMQSSNVSFLKAPANLLTSLRLLLLFCIFYHLPSLSDILIGGLAGIVLIMDGLDGYLARKFKTSSTFGAYLDMETDAFYVLSLTSIIYLQEKSDVWILLIGNLRYLYFILLLLVKPKQQKEERNYFAQVIAVVLMIGLITAFVMPPKFHQPLLIISSILVAGSFGKSFLLVLQRKFDWLK